MDQYAREMKVTEQRNWKHLQHIQQLQSAMDTLKSERQTSGMRFASYQEKVQEYRCMFLKCVEEMDKVKTIPVSIGVVGRTSAGKSSLLNRMFGTTCKVGATRCTNGVQEVWRYRTVDFKHHGVSIWDVFGFMMSRLTSQLKPSNTLCRCTQSCCSTELTLAAAKTRPSCFVLRI